MLNSNQLNNTSICFSYRSIKPTSTFTKVRLQLYNAPLWLTRHMNFGMIECKSLKVVAKVGNIIMGTGAGRSEQKNHFFSGT